MQVDVLIFRALAFKRPRIQAPVEIENTSALLGLYTRFLQCFVSADPTGTERISDSAFGSVDRATIPQNAGCTMAIHADCTTD
jgi:hypothetical protein